MPRFNLRELIEEVAAEMAREERAIASQNVTPVKLDLKLARTILDAKLAKFDEKTEQPLKMRLDKAFAAFADDTQEKSGGEQ